MSAKPYRLVRTGSSVGFATLEEAKRIWDMQRRNNNARGIAVIYGPNGFSLHCGPEVGAQWKEGDGRHKAERGAA